MTKEDREFIKESLPFYDNLKEDERNLLESSLIFTKHPKGTVLHRGSQDCLGLIIVKSGQLRAFIVSEEGKELTVYRLFEYDICLFSAACLFNNIEFDIYVEASAESEVYLIPSPVFNRLFNENIHVLKFTNNLLSSRFTEVMWIVEQAIFMSFDKRLALFLLEQMNIQNSNVLTLTHEEIAKNLASAREVVTRMLKYFQRENILKISRGKIEIMNVKKLKSLAE